MPFFGRFKNYLFKVKFKFFLPWVLLFLIILVWTANAIYASYVNYLKALQYRKLQELRSLREENYRLYAKIYKTLNYQNALKYATEHNYVPVKPYRVLNFLDALKGKPLYDFYFVWFGDTLSGIAKKLNLSVKDLIKANPSLRPVYKIGNLVIRRRVVIYPGMVLRIPVSFPVNNQPPPWLKELKEIEKPSLGNSTLKSSPSLNKTEDNQTNSDGNSK
jgi:LysM repeat protein